MELCIVVCDDRPGILAAARELWARWLPTADVEGFDSVRVECVPSDTSRGLYIGKWIATNEAARPGSLLVSIDSDVFPVPGALVRRCDLDPGPWCSLTAATCGYPSACVAIARRSGFDPDTLRDFANLGVFAYAEDVSGDAVRSMLAEDLSGWLSDEPCAQLYVEHAAGKPTRRLAYRYNQPWWPLESLGLLDNCKLKTAFVHYSTGWQKARFARRCLRTYGVEFPGWLDLG